MKSTFLILFLLLISGEFSFSQEIEAKQILTEQENVEWIIEFEKINSKNDRLKTIKKKVFNDRIFNINKRSCFNLVDYDSPYYRKEQFLYECKITFVLTVRKEVYLLDLLENSNSLKILNEVTPSHINNIEILHGGKERMLAHAYFGSSNCGIAVIINSDSKKLKREIKKML
jgi:hypothetical protein